MHMHAPQGFLKDNAYQGEREDRLKIPQGAEAEMQENSEGSWESRGCNGE